MRKKRIFAAILSLALLLSLAACGGGGGSAAAPPAGTGSGGGGDDPVVTLRIFAGWAEGNSNLLGMDDFKALVYEKTNGTLIIEWGGGPEAIPPFQLAEAILNGVVDMAWNAHTFHTSHIPVLEGVKLLDAYRLRENGGFEFINELYMSELNARYLGLVSDGLAFNLYSRVRIETLEDFRQHTFRSTPAYNAFMEALGAGAVNMNPGETYQALERDVIQGTGWPGVGIVDMGWHEVTSYVINPSFYNVDVGIFISNPAWDRLSANQQQALMDAALEIEIWSRTYYADAVQREQEALLALGMQIIEFPPDIKEQFLALAYDSAWASVLAVDPENGARLQEFAG